MSRTSDPSPPDVKALWKPILALSTWIAITFCANFSFAIKLSSVSDLDSTVLACANVLVALITGFITLFAYRASERKARSFWTRLALVSGGMFLLAFFLFMILRSLWTCQYTQEVRLVIGLSPTADLLSYLATFDASQTPTCSELLADYAGVTERMYAPTALIARFASLVVIFLVIWCSLACAVISIAYGLAAPTRPGERLSHAP